MKYPTTKVPPITRDELTIDCREGDSDEFKSSLREHEIVVRMIDVPITSPIILR
jgi:hypothetical protein